MKVFSFKADEKDLDRWRMTARRERITLGEWIRRRLNEPEAGPAPTLAVIAAKSRTSLVCEHRLPPGAYCKRCQVLKK